LKTEKTSKKKEVIANPVRYAFRLIADERQDAFLWDGWNKDTKTTLEMLSL
jgi:hypothetical protein